MSLPQFEINNEAVKDAPRMTREECPVILIACNTIIAA
jgi:glutamate racemase